MNSSKIFKTLAQTLTLVAAFSLTACEASNSPDVAIIQIKAAEAIHTFELEIADTDEERKRGLMFRQSLPTNGGMLFQFDSPRIISMWMKNTFIPLDMLFVRADGTIAHIAEWTEPHSLRSISSQEPVTFVIELAAGSAARLGIAPGATVHHELFGNANASE